MRKIGLAQAIGEAMTEEMARDETVYFIGPAYSRPPDLIKKFGKQRVRDAPLAENMTAGSSVGAALAGYRPIAGLSQADFTANANDELTQKAAFWRFDHGGRVTLPIVFMVNIGGYVGGGSEHSMSGVSEFWHATGLKIVMPSNPYDAKGLFKTAVRDNNPVVFCSHKMLRKTGEVPEEEYTIPFGVADIKREGKDVTVIATAYMVMMALDVAEQLEKEKGISVEVIDLRTLEPLDINTILASVKKTKRVVIVDEDVLRCGPHAEIAMRITENAWDSLAAPIRRVGRKNYPIPGLTLEKYVLPQPEDIRAAIEAVLR